MKKQLFITKFDLNQQTMNDIHNCEMRNKHDVSFSQKWSVKWDVKANKHQRKHAIQKDFCNTIVK